MPSAADDGALRHSARTNADRTAALVNALTVGDSDPEAIAHILREHGELDPVHVTVSDVRTMRAAAHRLRKVFAADGLEQAASRLNELLSETTGTLRLTAHDGTTPWHPHLDSHDDAPLGEWLLASSCLALLVLVWDLQRSPGGICASPSCQNVYVAQRSSPARRYCSRRCATRERVAAHRRAHQ